MNTKWCNTCEHADYCRGKYDEYTTGCSRYEKAKPKGDTQMNVNEMSLPMPKNGKPMTNEEWFDTLSTEEKAKVLRRRTYGNSEDNKSVEQGWINWLKAKHEDNPPDIPSVPSWDKWLQGEKTKCEYCDGNSTECELVGRSECPRTPKTEQEYIQTCTTEQLADKLTDFSFWLVVTIPTEDKREKVRKRIVEWLKQPHTKE